MHIRQKVISKLGWIIFIVISFTVSGVFLLNAINGPYGFMQRNLYENALATAKAEQKLLQNTLARLKDNTTRLSKEPLDLELLDQQIRAVLGYIRDNEHIIE